MDVQNDDNTTRMKDLHTAASNNDAVTGEKNDNNDDDDDDMNLILLDTSAGTTSFGAASLALNNSTKSWQSHPDLATSTAAVVAASHDTSSKITTSSAGGAALDQSSVSTTRSKSSHASTSSAVHSAASASSTTSSINTQDQEHYCTDFLNFFKSPNQPLPRTYTITSTSSHHHHHHHHHDKRRRQKRRRHPHNVSPLASARIQRDTLRMPSLQNQMQAVIRLQAWWRRWLAQRHYQTLKVCQTLLEQTILPATNASDKFQSSSKKNYNNYVHYRELQSAISNLQRTTQTKFLHLGGGVRARTKVPEKQTTTMPMSMSSSGESRSSQDSDEDETERNWRKDDVIENWQPNPTSSTQQQQRLQNSQPSSKSKWKQPPTNEMLALEAIYALTLAFDNVTPQQQTPMFSRTDLLLPHQKALLGPPIFRHAAPDKAKIAPKTQSPLSPRRPHGPPPRAFQQAAITPLSELDSIETSPPPLPKSPTGLADSNGENAVSHATSSAFGKSVADDIAPNEEDLRSLGGTPFLSQQHRGGDQLKAIAAVAAADPIIDSIRTKKNVAPLSLFASSAGEEEKEDAVARSISSSKEQDLPSLGLSTQQQGDTRSTRPDTTSSALLESIPLPPEPSSTTTRMDLITTKSHSESCCKPPQSVVASAVDPSTTIDSEPTSLLQENISVVGVVDVVEDGPEKRMASDSQEVDRHQNHNSWNSICRAMSTSSSSEGSISKDDSDHIDGTSAPLLPDSDDDQEPDSDDDQEPRQPQNDLDDTTEYLISAIITSTEEAPLPDAPLPDAPLPLKQQGDKGELDHTADEMASTIITSTEEASLSDIFLPGLGHDSADNNRNVLLDLTSKHSLAFADTNAVDHDNDDDGSKNTSGSNREQDDDELDIMTEEEEADGNVLDEEPAYTSSIFRFFGFGSGTGARAEPTLSVSNDEDASLPNEEEDEDELETPHEQSESCDRDSNMVVSFLEEDEEEEVQQVQEQTEILEPHSHIAVSDTGDPLLNEAEQPRVQGEISERPFIRESKLRESPPSQLCLASPSQTPLLKTQSLEQESGHASSPSSTSSASSCSVTATDDDDNASMLRRLAETQNSPPPTAMRPIMSLDGLLPTNRAVTATLVTPSPLPSTRNTTVMSLSGQSYPFPEEEKTDKMNISYSSPMQGNTWKTDKGGSHAHPITPAKMMCNYDSPQEQEAIVQIQHWWHHCIIERQRQTLRVCSTILQTVQYATQHHPHHCDDKSGYPAMTDQPMYASFVPNEHYYPELQHAIQWLQAKTHRQVAVKEYLRQALQEEVAVVTIQRWYRQNALQQQIQEQDAKDAWANELHIAALVLQDWWRNLDLEGVRLADGRRKFVEQRMMRRCQQREKQVQEDAARTLQSFWRLRHYWHKVAVLCPSSALFDDEGHEHDDDGDFDFDSSSDASSISSKSSGSGIFPSSSGCDTYPEIALHEGSTAVAVVSDDDSPMALLHSSHEFSPVLGGANLLQESADDSIDVKQKTTQLAMARLEAAEKVQAWFRVTKVIKTRKQLAIERVHSVPVALIQRTWRSYCIHRTAEHAADCERRGVAALIYLQASYRGKQARCQYKTRMTLSVRLQSIARGRQARTRFVTLLDELQRRRVGAAVCIQSMYRQKEACLVRNKLQSELELKSAVLLQSHARLFLANRVLVRSRLIAQGFVKLQALSRGKSSRFLQARLLEQQQHEKIVRSRLMAQGFVKLQALMRGKSSRFVQARLLEQQQHEKGLRDGCIRLQSSARRFLAQQKVDQMKAAKIHACMIQAKWRGFQNRRLYQQQLSLIITLQSLARGHAAALFVSDKRREWVALVTVQASVRMFLAEARLKRSVFSAKCIQSEWRRLHCQLYFQRTLASILKIQARGRRSLALGIFQKLIKARLGHAAIVVQRCLRGFLQRKAIRQCNEYAVKIQCHTRARLDRKMLGTWKTKAILVQAFWRQHLSSLLYQSCLRNVVILQSAGRKYLARRRYLLFKAERQVQLQKNHQRVLECAGVRTQYLIIRLQSLLRGRFSRRLFVRQQQAHRRLQAVARASHARKVAAAVSIQGSWRKQQVHGTKLAAAVKLQSAWRSVKVQRQFGDVKSVSVWLQARWRMRRTRTEYLVQQSASHKAQSLWRRFVARRRFIMDKTAAIIIQTRWRRKQAQIYYSHLGTNASLLQSFVRRLHAQRKYVQMKSSTLTLQRTYRGTLALASLSRQHDAAVRVQAVCRQFVIRQHYMYKLRAVVRGQAMVRKTRIRHVYHRKRRSCILLQAVARKLIERRQYSDIKSAARILQALGRRKYYSLRFRRTKLAAIKIQSAWRKCFALLPTNRSFVAHKKLSATTRIQCCYRSFVARRGLQKCLSGASLLQSHWRTIMQQ